MSDQIPQPTEPQDQGSEFIVPEQPAAPVEPVASQPVRIESQASAGVPPVAVPAPVQEQPAVLQPVGAQPTVPEPTAAQPAPQADPLFVAPETQPVQSAVPKREEFHDAGTLPGLVRRATFGLVTNPQAAYAVVAVVVVALALFAASSYKKAQPSDQNTTPQVNLEYNKDAGISLPKDAGTSHVTP